MRRETGPALGDVRDYWEQQACAEALYLAGRSPRDYASQLEARYRLEPYIPEFAAFESSHGQSVLEIGVGLGADHQRYAEAGARLAGVDLTARAMDHVRERFRALGMRSALAMADAAFLPYRDCTFDLVYSWGVLHHAPAISASLGEILRVLRPGGQARVMVYQRHSLVGYMLWIRYALLRLRPWTSLSAIYRRHVESPGTQAFTRGEAAELFSAFENVSISTVLTHADLLTSPVGQRHRGLFLSVARVVWPRWFLRRAFGTHGLFMLVRATKSRGRASGQRADSRSSAGERNGGA